MSLRRPRAGFGIRYTLGVESAKSWAIGKHVLLQEEPHLLLVTVDGDISPQEATAILAADTATFQRGGYALLLVDATKLGSVPAETRRTASRILAKTWPYDGPYLGSVAIFGANRYAVALLTLLLRAIHMIRKHSRPLPTFFTEEAAARKWLNERRSLHTAAAR